MLVLMPTLIGGCQFSHAKKNIYQIGETDADTSVKWIFHWYSNPS